MFTAINRQSTSSHNPPTSRTISTDNRNAATTAGAQEHAAQPLTQPIFRQTSVDEFLSGDERIQSKATSSRSKGTKRGPRHVTRARKAAEAAGMAGSAASTTRLTHSTANAVTKRKRSAPTEAFAEFKVKKSATNFENLALPIQEKTSERISAHAEGRLPTPHDTERSGWSSAAGVIHERVELARQRLNSFRYEGNEGSSALPLESETLPEDTATKDMDDIIWYDDEVDNSDLLALGDDLEMTAVDPYAQCSQPPEILGQPIVQDSLQDPDDVITDPYFIDLRMDEPNSDYNTLELQGTETTVPLALSPKPHGAKHGACSTSEEDFEDEHIFDELINSSLLDQTLPATPIRNPRKSTAIPESATPVSSSPTQLSVLLTPSPTSTSASNAVLKPIVRPPFPAPALDRSPILGLTTSTILRVCFRVGEAVNIGCAAVRNGANNILIELYARVICTTRDYTAGRQDFTLGDLFHTRPPLLKAVYEGWKGVSPCDYDSAVFLEGASEGQRMCRIVGRMKREGEDWILRICSIWEAGWEDVEHVKGIICG